MRTPTTVLIASVFICSCATAQAQGTKLYDDSPGVSARPKQTIASSNAWPLKKRYAEFTEVEKKRFHSQYESIADGDEPPYPIDGMEPIIRQMSEKLGGAVAAGEYHILVRVTADGEAKSVSLLKQPSIEHAKLVAYYLVTAKYKPALCAGKVCAMDFQFLIAFD